MKLREIKQGVDKIRRITSKAKHELELLLPIILGGAFRGPQTTGEE